MQLAMAGREKVESCFVVENGGDEDVFLCAGTDSDGGVGEDALELRDLELLDSAVHGDVTECDTDR